MKKEFKKRFKKIYPAGARLLAVHLDGFSHSLFYDNGKRSDQVIREEFSGCMPEGRWTSRAIEFFKGVWHNSYQNNAQEIIYILPEKR
jgi:hypothetical protein